MICAQVLLPKASGEGRVPAYGVLIPDAETRAAILAGRDVSLRQKPAPDGSLAVVEDIERLRREGQITDEAARAALQSLE